MTNAVDWFLVEDAMETLVRRFRPNSATGQRLMIVFAALQICREEIGNDAFEVPDTWWRIIDHAGHRHAIGTKVKPRDDYEINITDAGGRGAIRMEAGTFKVLDEPITLEQCEQWVTIGKVEPSLVVVKPSAEDLLRQAQLALVNRTRDRAGLDEQKLLDEIHAYWEAKP